MSSWGNDMTLHMVAAQNVHHMAGRGGSRGSSMGLQHCHQSPPRPGSVLCTGGAKKHLEDASSVPSWHIEREVLCAWRHMHKFSSNHALCTTSVFPVTMPIATNPHSG